MFCFASHSNGPIEVVAQNTRLPVSGAAASVHHPSPASEAKVKKRLDGGTASAIIGQPRFESSTWRVKSSAAARRGNIHADVFGVNDSGIFTETASFDVLKWPRTGTRSTGGAACSRAQYRLWRASVKRVAGDPLSFRFGELPTTTNSNDPRHLPGSGSAGPGLFAFLEPSRAKSEMRFG